MKAFITTLAHFASALALFVSALEGQGIPKFPLEAGPLELSGPVNPWRFINAVGEKAGVWGYESGRLEGWVYPLKIFHDFHLTFEVEGLPQTYEGDQIVRSVRVYPHAVQLQYAAEQFSVEETLLVPRHDPGFDLFHNRVISRGATEFPLRMDPNTCRLLALE